MCNPDDDRTRAPRGTPTQAQIDNDHRTLAQRQHDALIAIGRIALMSGELGHLNGLPVSIIIRTTLPRPRIPRRGRRHRRRHHPARSPTSSGWPPTPTTTWRCSTAPPAHALDLFRTRRTASPAQRIMLIARDGGCTKPGCTVRRLRLPSPPRHHRLGRRRQHQRRRPRPGLRTRQPPRRPTAAGPPPSTTATTSNGSHHPTSTPAKPASTTTTAPNDSSDHPTTTTPT